MDVTKRRILTNGDYNMKMANFGEKGKFGKNDGVPKIHQGFGPIF